MDRCAATERKAVDSTKNVARRWQDVGCGRRNGVGQGSADIAEAAPRSAAAFDTRSMFTTSQTSLAIRLVKPTGFTR